MIRRGWFLAAMVLGIGSTTSAEVTLRIAAASNLHVVAPLLKNAYESAHPGVRLDYSFAASGGLVAQIRQGAPFDILLSADLIYPTALIESDHAEKASLITFAHGQLVLWPRPRTADWMGTLRNDTVRRIAIAQPDIAPYGRATRRALEAADLWAEVEPRLVFGENAAQTLHFAESGNADYAFVAASLLVGQPQLGEGLPISIDGNELAHGAVVIQGRPHAREAAVFLAWLGSKTAQKILTSHGYRLP